MAADHEDRHPTDEPFIIWAPEPAREAQWQGVTDLTRLRDHVLLCQGCGLRGTAKGVVFGEGEPRARVMFVGEGPGENEDETGVPFVGRAGKLLDRMLDAAGLGRHEVYITNVVKCRPPKNRMPLPAEIEACLPNLRAQIRLIRPRIIVTLGALASQTLIDPSIRVTKDRGRWYNEDGIHYLVTFHPAAVLRDEARKMPEVLRDFHSLKEKLSGI